MPLSDVTVEITLDKPAGLLGFGKPLILAVHTAAVAYKEYADMDAVKADFPDTTDAYKMAAVIFAQEHAPRTVAIAAVLTAAGLLALLQSVYARDWYFLLTTSTTQADLITLGDEIEAKGRKMAAFRAGTQAILDALKVKEYDRVFMQYTETLGEYPDAAWVGEAGSQDVGSITWKFKKLNGITPQDVTATELLAIHNAGGNTYLTKAGDNVTSEGRVVSGEYIDVIMSKDWVQAEIELRIQKVFNKLPKVPYDNNGIASLESATIDAMKRGFNQGMIATDDDNLPLYGTDFPTRSEVDPVERGARIYSGATFWFELAGAIHEARIKGTIRV